MDVIGGIITAGVTVVAMAVIANVAGTTLLNLPVFGTAAVGGASAKNFQEMAWNATMSNVSVNSLSSFSLLSITPLVVAASLIIAILLGVFILRR